MQERFGVASAKSLGELHRHQQTLRPYGIGSRPTEFSGEYGFGKTEEVIEVFTGLYCSLIRQKHEILIFVDALLSTFGSTPVSLRTSQMETIAYFSWNVLPSI